MSTFTGSRAATPKPRRPKILFSTDFSEGSEAARSYATVLARDRDATMLIVHVNEPAPVYAQSGAFGGLPLEIDEAAAERMLQQVIPGDPRVHYEHRLLHGQPARELVNLAKDERVDLIVMGTHGRRGILRVLMGSIAEEVVRRAVCPVLTVKQPQHTAVTP